MYIIYLGGHFFDIHISKTLNSMHTFRESVKCIEKSYNLTSFKQIWVGDRAKKKSKISISPTFLITRGTYFNDLSSYENKTFNAVPKPTVWTLPQSLHFSQPTQSIILDTLRKWSLNSFLRIYT